MKIVLILLTVVLFKVSAVETYAQSTRIDLNMKNSTVKEVLKDIESKSEFTFFYNDNAIDTNRRVSINVAKKRIDEILTVILPECSYKVENKKIIIVPKALEDVATAQQQGKKLTGKVVDHNNEPIIGAAVAVAGTTIGTVTDIDGNFALQVPDNATLQVSYIGYQSFLEKVGNQTNLMITLKEDTQLIDEVVVVGYGTQKKVNLTGAITSVKTDDLNKIPTSNLSNTLAGRAPGVTVTTTSGMAGASSKIRMRGSFGEPLFVINNVIKDKAAFDALDPNEVDNISFLKDAASASIYGSKAGNGVVLVTTKAGKNQKPEFQYKGVFSVSNTTRPLQDYSATDELIWANRVAETKGLPSPYGQEIFDYFADKSYNVNDYVWRNPSSQQHNISVNGGSDRITYYMMLGFHDENGSYKKLDFQKYVPILRLKYPNVSM